jgi:SPP1 gp7 family putative phage head morphogenesis protein
VTYNEARLKEFTGLDEGEYPYLRIEIVDDDATRQSHRELAGYTRRRGDPVWNWLRPPFEFNCRCTVRVVHVSEEVEESDWVPDRSRYEFLR